MIFCKKFCSIKIRNRYLNSRGNNVYVCMYVCMYVCTLTSNNKVEIAESPINLSWSENRETSVRGPCVIIIIIIISLKYDKKFKTPSGLLDDR